LNKCLNCENESKWKGLCKKCYYEDYNLKNKDRIKEVNKAYKLRYFTIGPLTQKEKELKMEVRKQKIKVTNKHYIDNNREHIRKLQREWKRKNWITIKQKFNEKYQNNIQYKLTILLRNTLVLQIKKSNTKKYDKTIKLLGCSIQQFKQHIEEQFKPGMTWENHSFYGWHIDHIKPISKFDLTKEEEQRKCFHYKNLQPLWAIENLSKNGRYEETNE